MQPVAFPVHELRRRGPELGRSRVAATHFPYECVGERGLCAHHTPVQ